MVIKVIIGVLVKFISNYFNAIRKLVNHFKLIEHVAFHHYSLYMSLSMIITVAPGFA